MRSLGLATLALPLGAAIAFLSGETAGMALVFMLPAAIVFRARSPGAFPLLVAVFGVGFATGAAYLAVPTLLGRSGDGSAGLIAYAAAQLGIGASIIVLGLALYLRRSPLNGA